MDGISSNADFVPRPRKRRIPKACGTCRQSKVKCDGKRPCSRCLALKKVCTFVERPKDAQESKIENLEKEIQTLKDLLQTQPDNNGCQVDNVTMEQRPASDNFTGANDERLATLDTAREPSQFTVSAQSMSSIPVRDDAVNHASIDACSWHLSASSHGSPSMSLSLPARDLKRKRSVFVMRDIAIPDFVTAGLLTEEQANSYFTAFFHGCDRYVPIFDPRYDTMADIRNRSSLLFSVIVAVGYRVTRGTESNEWHRLDFHIRRMLTAAITASTKTTMETIQALLVRACYASERSLLLAVATRMALDLGLPEAYNELNGRLISRETLDVGRTSAQKRDDELILMRKTRTWLHLLVLGNILHVDAGNLPSFEFRGNVRRCRILLDSQFSTAMDLSLFSQVELNVLRAEIYSRLAGLGNCDDDDDDDIMDVITDAKIDIDVWYNDWIRIIDRAQTDTSWLRLNLQIQRCWSDCMALCRAVRTSGVENVDAMSPTQKNILLMAKDALTQHFIIIIEEPRVYLRHLRFAMDFVWAKCAFCYLLLLKLSVLLPDDSGKFGRSLIEDGDTLVNELRAVVGGSGGQESSNTSRIYLHLLQSGIEKYRRATRGDRSGGAEITRDASNVVSDATRKRATAALDVENAGRPDELESFVPDQFIFEWDFPGLTLFSSPMVDTGWLDEFLSGSFGAEDEPFGLGWLQA